MLQSSFRPSFAHAPILLGKLTDIRLANGEHHRAIMAIVDLGDILASHNEHTFSPTEGFPTYAGDNANDRNYQRDQSAQRNTRSTAQHLDPLVLINDSKSPKGTPIITPDGIVISGNGRTMALKLASTDYPENYEAYLQKLWQDGGDFGFTSYTLGPAVLKQEFKRPTNDLNKDAYPATAPERVRFERPVLVRIILDFPSYTQAEFAKYNQQTGKAETPLDRSVKLAHQLQANEGCRVQFSDLLAEAETFSEFYDHPTQVLRMRNLLIKCGLLGEHDVAAIFTEKNQLTAAGKELVQQAAAGLLLGRAALEAADSEGVQQYRQHITTCLPVLLKNETLGSFSLRHDLNEAILAQRYLVTNHAYTGSSATEEAFRASFGTQSMFAADDQAPVYSRRVLYLNRLLSLGRVAFKASVEAINNSGENAIGGDIFDNAVTPAEAFNRYVVDRVKAKLPATAKFIDEYVAAYPIASPAPQAPASTPVPAVAHDETINPALPPVDESVLVEDDRPALEEAPELAAPYPEEVPASTHTPPMVDVAAPLAVPAQHMLDNESVGPQVSVTLPTAHPYAGRAGSWFKKGDEVVIGPELYFPKNAAGGISPARRDTGKHGVITSTSKMKRHVRGDGFGLSDYDWGRYVNIKYDDGTKNLYPMPQEAVFPAAFFDHVMPLPHSEEIGNTSLSSEREPTPEPASCPPRDVNGVPLVDPDSLQILNRCLSVLPQTKSLHVDSTGNYTPERMALHQRIIDKYTRNRPCRSERPIALLTGGPPGAGKSELIKNSPFAWVNDERKVIHVDADAIRAELPEYQGWNAAQTHAETKDLVKEILDHIGEPCSHDIVYDGTMNKINSYLPLIAHLKELGYEVYIMFVKVSFEISKERVLERYQRTGRYVPLEVVEEAYYAGDAAYKEIRQQVSGYVTYDGASGELLEEGGQPIPSTREEAPEGERYPTVAVAQYIDGQKVHYITSRGLPVVESVYSEEELDYSSVAPCLQAQYYSTKKAAICAALHASYRTQGRPFFVYHDPKRRHLGKYTYGTNVLPIMHEQRGNWFADGEVLDGVEVGEKIILCQYQVGNGTAHQLLLNVLPATKLAEATTQAPAGPAAPPVASLAVGPDPELELVQVRARAQAQRIRILQMKLKNRRPQPALA